MLVAFSSRRGHAGWRPTGCQLQEHSCSPARINRRDTAPTPTGFAEIVSDAFPGFHALQYARLRFSGQRDWSAQDAGDSKPPWRV